MVLQALRLARDGRESLLVLDGLDEIPDFIDTCLEWIKCFNAQPVAILITSRPSALRGKTSAKLGDCGFKAKKIVDLTQKKVNELTDLVLKRLCASDDQVAQVREQVRRPEYVNLVRVPITLTLLIHVLMRSSSEGRVLTKGQVYHDAIELTLQVDELKTRFRRRSSVEGDGNRYMQRSEAIKCLRAIAFSNMKAGKRTQGWQDITTLSREQRSAIGVELVEGRLAVLEVNGRAGGSMIGFTHLSYQVRRGSM